MTNIVKNEDYVYPICVIGGGAAGVMATLRCVLNNDETILFPGNKHHRRRSRAFWVSKVENMPGYLHYSKGIDHPNRDTLNWLINSEFKEKFHYHKNLGAKSITKLKSGLFEIVDDNDVKYLSQYVILCTGVMDVQPKINGTIKPILPFANVQLADYCLRCDGHHVFQKDTSIIFDGNDGGAWVSIMLMERYNCPSMSLISNGAKINISEKVMSLLNKHNVSIIDKEIIEVNGKAKDHHLESFVFKDESVLKTDICFISLGMIVYNDLAKNLSASLDDRGFVITNEKGLTSVENFFVAGDLRAGIKKQIYTAWDSAVDSADQINSMIRMSNRNY